MININLLKYKFLKTYTGLVFTFLSFCAVPLYAHEKKVDSDKLPIIISIESFKAYKETPSISTTVLDLFYPITAVDGLNLVLYTGLTATRETDFIIQSTDQGSVWGIGPNIFASVDIMRWRNVSFLFDASGAFILYNKDFPAGGEHYNFIWRAGPTVSYSFDNSYSLGICYQWMHVSNGQNTNNPGYEAYGFGLQFSKVF